jgi:hypothetical protein
VLLPPPARLVEDAEHRGGAAVDRHEVVLAPEEVQLPRRERRVATLGGVDDDEVVAGVHVAARALVVLHHLLERVTVKPELAPQQSDLGHAGVGDVEPEPVLRVGEQLAEPFDADLGRRDVPGSVNDEAHVEARVEGGRVPADGGRVRAMSFGLRLRSPGSARQRQAAARSVGEPDAFGGVRAQPNSASGAACSGPTRPAMISATA